MEPNRIESIDHVDGRVLARNVRVEMLTEVQRRCVEQSTMSQRHAGSRMALAVPSPLGEEGGKTGGLAARRRRTSLVSPSISMVSSARSGEEAANGPSSRRRLETCTRRRQVLDRITPACAFGPRHDTERERRRSKPRDRHDEAILLPVVSGQPGRQRPTMPRRSETLTSSDSAVRCGSGERSSRALIWLFRNRSPARAMQAGHPGPTRSRSIAPISRFMRTAPASPGRSPELDRGSDSRPREARS